MPKDEFDFDDPLELNGMALPSEVDTTDAMTECFVEEFLRMGYTDRQILALFRNPHYLGMNMVLQNRGEVYVKECIATVFARWGRTPSPEDAAEVESAAEARPAAFRQKTSCREQMIELDSAASDPMGAAIPRLNS